MAEEARGTVTPAVLLHTSVPLLTVGVAVVMGVLVAWGPFAHHSAYVAEFGLQPARLSRLSAGWEGMLRQGLGHDDWIWLLTILCLTLILLWLLLS